MLQVTAIMLCTFIIQLSTHVLVYVQALKYPKAPTASALVPCTFAVHFQRQNTNLNFPHRQKCPFTRGTLEQNIRRKVGNSCFQITPRNKLPLQSCLLHILPPSLSGPPCTTALMISAMDSHHAKKGTWLRASDSGVSVQQSVWSPRRDTCVLKQDT